ncbi:MAG: hypothetical protein DRR19_23320 [Candidatus Parabeggiatoa sp. nov. 1]|nr:MAG: hypothetical protein DRR19_23320 [Gammaproteobacteria bacterium]
MKNRLYLSSLLILLMFSPLVFAIPPYLGVATGENLSFNNPSCLQAAKKVLKNDGFQKVVQYQQSTSIFAAYQNEEPYHYKALVKCLAGSSVIVVVVVANVAINARKKAELLLQKIQHSTLNKRAKIIKNALKEVAESVTPPKKEPLAEEVEKNGDKQTSTAEQYTMFTIVKCLDRAELSLRNSGFYKDFDFDDDSIYATNENGFKGLIRCVNSESLVTFKVKGDNASTRDKLLNQLQKNF